MGHEVHSDHARHKYKGKMEANSQPKVRIFNSRETFVKIPRLLKHFAAHEHRVHKYIKISGQQGIEYRAGDGARRWGPRLPDTRVKDLAVNRPSFGVAFKHRDLKPQFAR